MGSLFSKPKMPGTALAPMAEADLEAIREAANAESQRLRKRRGFASSIFTSVSGDTSIPTTLKAKLGE